MSALPGVPQPYKYVVGNDDKMFVRFVIYVGGVILYLDFACISINNFQRLHSCVEVFTRGMFRGGDICVLDLCFG